jgi:hypothetical protein
LDDLAVREAADGDVVDLDEDVALLEAIAPRPVQDLVHLRSESAVGNGEPEPQAALGDGDPRDVTQRRRIGKPVSELESI